MSVASPEQQGVASQSLEAPHPPSRIVRSVRRPRTREAVPKTEHPNFRDSGRSVDAPMLRVLTNLQRKYGEAFVAEAGLRKMVCEDTGLMPGQDTIRRALERLERKGLIEQEWLHKGDVLPNGAVAFAGMHLVIVPVCRTTPGRWLERKLARKRLGAFRREGIRAAQGGESVSRLLLAKTQAVPPPPAPPVRRHPTAAEIEAILARPRPRDPPG